MKKHLSLLLTLLFLSLYGSAQTTVIDPAGNGGFETGTDFPSNGWTVVNGTANQWAVGTGSVFAGARGAYIGTPTSFTGTNSSKVNHFYRDVTIPAGATSVILSWEYKQPVTDNTFDKFFIFTTSTSNTPVAGTVPGSGYTQQFLNTATAYPSYTLLSVNLNSLAGTTFRLVFTYRNDGSAPIGIPAVDNISLTYILPPPCSGTPTPGTIVASQTSGCSTYTSNLSLSGTSVALGLAYQWQSSPDNSTWTPVPGATAPTYSASVSSSIYYQCLVTCTNTGGGTAATPSQLLAFTNPTYATLPVTEGFEGPWLSTCATDDKPSIYWLATPVTGNTSWRRDDDGASAGWGIPGSYTYTPAGSNAGGASSAHSARYHQGNISAGTQSSLSLFVNMPAGTKKITYDYINLSSTTGANSSIVLQVSVDGGTTFTNIGTLHNGSIGWTTFTELTTASSPTAILRWVGTADFGVNDIGLDNVNVTLLPACSGTPTAGTVASSATTGCGIYSSNLTLAGASASSFLTYQWQSSPDNATWTPVVGGSNPSYTASVLSTIYYRSVLTCTVSGLSAATPGVQLTNSSSSSVATLPFTEGFEAAWINGCATADKPNNFWINVPATGNPSWRREDDAPGPNTAGWTSPTSYGYTPAGSNAGGASSSHSARFHQGFVTGGGQGQLILAVNFPPGNKQISYDYINGSSTTGANSSIQLQVSTDGGVTYTNVGTRHNGPVGWTTLTQTTTASSPTALLRWLTTSDFGSFDIGIDNVNITQLCFLPVITGTSQSLCTGGNTLALSATPLGTWSSSNTTAATIGSTGIVTSAANGVTVISNNNGVGCIATDTITVNQTPPAIGGAAVVCQGATTPLTDALTGGTWSSNSTVLATIGSTSGILTGVAGGGTTITYAMPTGCLTTTPITVNSAPNTINFSLPSMTPPCLGLSSAVTVNSATLGNGTFTVTYNLSGANIATGNTATLTMSAGAGTFATSALGSTGATVLTITSISNALGCITNLSSSNTLSFTVNPNPSTIGGPTFVCAGTTITLTDGGGGTWISNNTAVATVDISLGIVTGVSGGSPVITYTLPTGCIATATLSVVAVLPITGIAGLCTGQTTTLADAATGGTWSSSNTAIATIGSATGFLTGGATTGSTTIRYTLTSTGCFASLSFGVTNAPVVYTITGGGTFCAGGAGVHVGLTGSDPSVSYQVFVGGIATGSPVPGTGGILDLGLQTATGTYTVVANPGSGCATTMSGSVTVSTSPLPTVYNVTGGGSFCAGGIGFRPLLSNSDFGFNYQLFNGSLPVGSLLAGVHGPLTFPLQTTTGTYTVVAINGTSGCTSNMTGSAPITNNPLPIAYIVTGGGSLCAGGAGVNVSLSNSEVGTTYFLKNGATTVTTLVGTGASMILGTQTVGGIYTVTATSVAGCSASMTGSATVVVNPNPVAYNVTGGGAFCTGGTGAHIGLNGSDVGVTYLLKNAASTAGTATGTSFAIDFGLETAAGTYTVVGSYSTGCTTTMIGNKTITINTLPNNTYTVTGGGSYCTGSAGVAVGLSLSDVGINYQLLNGSTPVGAVVAGTGAAIPFGIITVPGTYFVQATNPLTTCSVIMAGSTAVVLNTPPPAFTVLGGGGYCFGGTGVSVVLNGSTGGVNYQLYNGTTPIGGIVPGTGFALNFGLQPLAGSYNVIATNPATTCTSNMTGSTTVSVNPLPQIYTVSGGGGYCPGGVGVHVGLSGSDIGVNYQLMNGLLNVGSAVAGTGAALDFGLQTTLTNYTVVGTNAVTGCTSTMLGFSSVTLNTIPGLHTVTSSGSSYCAGATGITIGLNGADNGINYQLYNGSTPVGVPVPGLGVPISFGAQTAAGNYTVIATNAATSCANNMTGNAIVVVNPLPTVFTVTGGGGYCTGGSGVNVGLGGSAIGVNYQLMNGGPVGVLTPGTGTALDFGLQTATGSYTVVATDPATTCSSPMFSSATVTMNAPPTVVAMTGGGSYCAGGGGRLVGLGGSSTGVGYQLFNGVAMVGSPLPGTGGAISFGLQTAAGRYTVVATNVSSICSSNMSGADTITITPLPTAFNLTGGGNYCLGGTGVHVGLSNSSSSVSYQLFDGSITVDGPVLGIDTALDFGLELAAGTYTVIGTDANTGCSNNMTGSSVVNIQSLPALYVITGGGNHCPGSVGVPVMLNGSDAGFSYQLLRDNIPVGSAMAGTGAFLNFGLQAAVGNYTVLATNSATGCTNTMSSSVNVSLYSLPAIDTVMGGGNYCPGGTGVAVTLSSSSTGVNYQLRRDGLNTGSAVMGTGSSINFGSQTATGSYTVVAADATTTCAANMSGNAVVGNYPLPASFTVSGGGNYCPGTSGVHVIVSGSETGVNYQLFDNTVATGAPLGGSGSSIDFGAQTAVGNYTVVATNTTTGCSSNMTHSATVSNYPLPGVYTVTGGGNYCNGGTGVAITLAGSDAGVNYQLYHDGSIIGGPIAGTGSGLNFGAQTATGNYTVRATNATTGCINSMMDTAMVGVNSLPTVYSVAGSGSSYCAGGGGVNVYITNSDPGVNYQLYHGSVAVGAPVLGTGSPLDFGMQTGAGSYTMIAVNATTGCTSNMSGTAIISILPVPPVYNVIGGGGYCVGNPGVHIGLDGSMSGISYQLWRGSVAVGTAVAGTGAAFDFGVQTVAGPYTVVATNAVTGCSSNMAGTSSVIVNPLPGTYSVTGGGNYCSGGTGVAIGLSGSDAFGVTYQLMRGGATAVGVPVASTGGALGFGLQTAAGNYTIVATNTSTSCSAIMASSANIAINSLPTVYSMTGGGGYCNGGTGTAVGLSGSNTGINYQLLRGGVAVGGLVAGSGGSVSFGLETTPGAYTVIATNGSTSCTSNMAGAATVAVNPLPTVFNVTGGGNYCVGGTGVPVNIDGSAVGVSYQLFLGHGSVGSTVPGTGSPLNLGVQTGVGTYTVVATNTGTACTSNMSGSANITVTTPVTPTVSISTGVGDTVCSGTSTTFSALAANGGTAPVYQWTVNGAPASFGSSYTYIPSNGDNVGVTLTSSATCAIPASVTSTFVINVAAHALPTVSVTLSPGNIVCMGTTVNFTANETYGGTAPTYTWLSNGISIGSGTSFAYVPNDRDLISVQMTSNYPCRLANIVSSDNTLMTVDSPTIPVVTIAAYPSAHVSEGTPITLTATVDHGGSAPSYQWYVNGTAIDGAVTPTFVNSNYTTGDSVSCVVTSSGICSGQQGFNSLIIFTNVGVTQVTNGASNIKLIPNPNNGMFAIRGSLGTVTNDEVSIEIYDMLGQIVYKNKVSVRNGNIDEQVKLNDNLANGMYILNLLSDNQNNVFHFVIEK